MPTPDQYPRSLNALVNACNQKSSREPVLSLDRGIVQHTVNDLVAKQLVMAGRIESAPASQVAADTTSADVPQPAAMAALEARVAKLEDDLAALRHSLRRSSL